MVGQEIQALMAGSQRGQNEMAGVLPSAQEASGQPAPRDPLSSKFQQILAQCNGLSADLAKMGAQKDAHMVAKVALQLQQIELNRAQKAAQDAVNGGAGNMANPANGIAAFGVPNR